MTKPHLRTGRRRRTGDQIAAAAIVGTVLRQMRERAGLSIADVARDLDCAESWVCRLEHGRALPTLLTAARLAHACRGSLAELGDVLDRVIARESGRLGGADPHTSEPLGRSDAVAGGGA